MSGSNLTRCQRCGLPETYETIEFDEFGVCNICLNQEFKQQEIDWRARFEQLETLFELHPGKYSYDFVVLFSGGKD